MEDVKEQKNQEAVLSFLKNNDISPDDIMNFSNKFITAYYVGESRKFSEETTVGFNILDKNAINISLIDINDIEYETNFKIVEQKFNYDELHETLTIRGNNTNKHNEDYKIVISSIYLDL